MEKLEFHMGLLEKIMRSSWERIGSIEDPPSPEPGDIEDDEHDRAPGY